MSFACTLYSEKWGGCTPPFHRKGYLLNMPILVQKPQVDKQVSEQLDDPVDEQMGEQVEAGPMDIGGGTADDLDG